jgi:hypothetical protein
LLRVLKTRELKAPLTHWTSFGDFVFRQIFSKTSFLTLSLTAAFSQYWP